MDVLVVVEAEHPNMSDGACIFAVFCSFSNNFFETVANGKFDIISAFLVEINQINDGTCWYGDFLIKFNRNVVGGFIILHQLVKNFEVVN